MAAKLTQKQQQIIVLAVIFVFGFFYVYWTYLLKPTLADIKEKREKLSGLEQKIVSAEKQARRLPALKNEKEKLTIELARLEKQLPREKDTPNIIRTLTREALQENLEFVQLRPKPNENKNFFEIIPFDLQMKGTLNQLARFLASLGQSDRIFKAENFTLAPIGNEESSQILLNISYTLKTYAFTGAQ